MEEQELTEQMAAIEHLMLRVAWLEQRCLARELDNLGLTVPQLLVLRSIQRRAQQPTMSTLADDTLQRCATMTGIVGRLVKLGLVARERDPHDRRRVLVQLTPAGRAVLENARGCREKRLRDTLAYLHTQDALELLRLLRLYLEAFRLRYEKVEGEPLSEAPTITVEK